MHIYYKKRHKLYILCMNNLEFHQRDKLVYHQDS